MPLNRRSKISIAARARRLGVSLGKSADEPLPVAKRVAADSSSNLLAGYERLELLSGRVGWRKEYRS